VRRCAWYPSAISALVVAVCTLVIQSMIVNSSLRLRSLNARSCVISHVQLYFTFYHCTTLCYVLDCLELTGIINVVLKSLC